MIKILYQNPQWMLEADSEHHTDFLVEKKLPSASMTTDAEIKANEGYWYEAKYLARKDGDDYNPVYHIGQKTWVDLDLFEEAVKATFFQLRLEPDFDVDATFKRLRIEKAREAKMAPGIYKPSEIPGEILA